MPVIISGSANRPYIPEITSAPPLAELYCPTTAFASRTVGSYSVSIFLPSVDDRSWARVNSPSSSSCSRTSWYSASGNAASAVFPTNWETPKAIPPATTTAPATIPTISPVRLFRGG